MFVYDVIITHGEICVGLLAFGVFHIKSGALPAWKYLFVIEVRGSSAEQK